VSSLPLIVRLMVFPEVNPKIFWHGTGMFYAKKVKYATRSLQAHSHEQILGTNSKTISRPDKTEIKRLTIKGMCSLPYMIVKKFFVPLFSDPEHPHTRELRAKSSVYGECPFLPILQVNQLRYSFAILTVSQIQLILRFPFRSILKL
jgi:hypothetical protein